jgi:acetoin:2,6-dichlorophenolindophenol oxidoreductase subunit alpha
MYTIRRFEETVLENFSKGVFFGTTHAYLGQEANAAGLLCHLKEGDLVFSNHRCHGHFLAYGGDPRALFAELMGKTSGVSGGRGGSQHLHWRNFYSNGVQGGIAPVAAGMALAEKIKGAGTVAIAFLGDGTLGEGTLYEALNLASLWQAPVLWVVENNRIAQTTPIELSLAGDIAVRFRAFGIPVEMLDSSDVMEIMPLAAAAIIDVRERQAPGALVLHTHRFGPHSKGDDTRPTELIEQLRKERDPLAIHASRMREADRLIVQQEVEAQILRAYQQALADPYPELDATAPGASA